MRQISEPSAPTTWTEPADPTDADAVKAALDASDAFLIPMRTAESFVRVARADERTLLAKVLIPAAVRQWEEWTGRALLSRQVEHVVAIGRWERFCELPDRCRLPLEPTITLDEVAVRNDEGEETKLDADFDADFADLFTFRAGESLVLLHDLSEWPYAASERRFVRWRWTAGYEFQAPIQSAADTVVTLTTVADAAKFTAGSFMRFGAQGRRVSSVAGAAVTLASAFNPQPSANDEVSTVAPVPAHYIHAIHLLIGLFYENRDLVVGGPGTSVSELPGPISELIDSQSVLL